jgi:hypothetical protein
MAVNDSVFRKPLIGELLTQQGRITEQQLQEALSLQAKLPTYKPLGQILIDRHLISENELNNLLDTYGKRPRLGEILIKMKLITTDQLEAALKQKKEDHRRLGEILLALHYLTEDSLKQALALQFNIPYVDLTVLPIDPELQKVINPSYARKQQVAVLSQVGRMLTIAIGDPTKATVVADLRALGFTVNVAIAKFPKGGISGGMQNTVQPDTIRRPPKAKPERDEWLG